MIFCVMYYEIKICSMLFNVKFGQNVPICSNKIVKQSFI